LDDFISSCAEDAAEDQELDPRWDDADWRYPFRVVSYEPDSTSYLLRGFRTHAEAIDYFWSTPLRVDHVITVETLAGLVTHHRGHTLGDEIDHCWFEHGWYQHSCETVRNYHTACFLAGIDVPPNWVPFPWQRPHP
jgi:hypothetical protein